jgi:hypothetical protein
MPFSFSRQFLLDFSENLGVFSSFLRVNSAQGWPADCRSGSFLHTPLPEFQHLLKGCPASPVKPPQVYPTNGPAAATLAKT